MCRKKAKILVLQTISRNYLHIFKSEKQIKRIFYLQPSYWFPEISGRKTFFQGKDLENGFETDAKKSVEPVPDGAEVTVNIVNMSKTYGTSWLKKLFDCKFVNFLIFLLFISLIFGLIILYSSAITRLIFYSRVKRERRRPFQI